MTEQTPPRQVIPLNGVWELQPSDDPAPPARWNHTVPVPALVDAARPAHGWEKFRYHWYRRTFTAPAPAAAAYLVVEQSMFGTEVWVNGRHLGGDITCYTSQEYSVHPVLRRKGENDVVVRVGRREDLPAHSAVGADQERTSWIPGIWGDVYVVRCGMPRIVRVFAVPHIGDATAELRVTLENPAGGPAAVTVTTRILEKQTGREVSPLRRTTAGLPAGGTVTVTVEHHLTGLRLWSPVDPFLYVAESTVSAGGNASDMLRTVFGMREFRMEGRDFLLNGKVIRLRGGNIAFHRFLSDTERGTLPWDPAWVKRLLIDIPKDHHFNFFRNHLGQMYNRWYDIADEHGMLLQNEWMFWTTTGTPGQITAEFTRWLHDNGNHPSIIIWDALNESSDPAVQQDIVPAMKRIDPTRPWESVDIVEEHPYIYSLGPVLNSRRLGFTRALDDIAASPQPTMLNEFCWWWLDRNERPAPLMAGVVERWLGPDWTGDELVAHQGFLARELVELFRRMRVNAIQPFVYLSNSSGPTAHWFSGDIAKLMPKPVLAALRDAFAPFGVSIELWDRHFTCGEQRTVRVFVFNDEPVAVRGELSCALVDAAGRTVFERTQAVLADPSADDVIPVTVPFPVSPGAYILRAVLSRDHVPCSTSGKEVHVFAPIERIAGLENVRVGVVAETDEPAAFLAAQGVDVVRLPEGDLRTCRIVVAGEGSVRRSAYRGMVDALGKFVNDGGILVIIEPECGVEGKESASIIPGVNLAMERRFDQDKGGYDSYVHPSDNAHPLWRGLFPEHLRMFNGGYGGEVVSEHTVIPEVPYIPLARCGLELAIPAVMEIRHGKGSIFISRLQLRGRLLRDGAADTLYARRPDPVLQRFFLNLLCCAGGWK
jgi:beta-galactosidase